MSNGLYLPPSPQNGVGDSTDSDFEGFVDEGEGTTSSGSSFDELEDAEFPNHFIERDSRLFHSTSAPYPLPVDTPEQQRYTVSHNVLKRLMGANYVGPVHDVLVNDQDRKVLDLCNGNGRWLIELSETFPHVDFQGLDHVPIATRYPPSNVRFIIGDVNSALDWRDGTFDFVQARDTTMAVFDYRALVDEVARILKPGGLFLSIEWDRSPHFHPSFGQDPAESVPAYIRFHQAVTLALNTAHGIHYTPLQCSNALFSSPHFHPVEPREFHVPIGRWDESTDLSRSIGSAFKVAHLRFVRACKHLLIDHTDLSANEVNAMIQDCVEEIGSTDGLMSTVHVAYGTKA